MVQEHDAILIGTGVAPLVAASRLLSAGHSCLILNPDADFFLEDSELPLDPWFPLSTMLSNPSSMSSGTHSKTLKVLEPDFPGAIESWVPHRTVKQGFHDPAAPHLRARTRLWMRPSKSPEQWDLLEDLFLKAQEQGLSSQVLEGVAAIHRFPGYGGKLGHHQKAVSIADLYDLDLTRYRNELLEFVREKGGAKNILCGVSLSEWLEKGLRYYHSSQVHTVRSRSQLFLYWTPRLSSWISRITSKATLASLPKPLGLRLWEEWTLGSREFIDPAVIGIYDDMTVYSDYEGLPPRDKLPLNRLKILKPSNLLPWNINEPLPRGLPFATSETLESLTQFCEGFLSWDKFSIHEMKPKLVFEWQKKEISSVAGELKIVSGIEGPIHQVLGQSLSSLSGVAL